MYKGTPDPVTFISLLKVVGFIIGGFLASYAVNRFILVRIYDLFLVDSGVQHTVTSIMRYIIFAITILVGFSYVGLGQHIGYLLAALAVSIGWVLKDPINDFISYFIILVQRPIKIGDYVQINKETQGVVRRITPRSVILRRKNSTTLVVPNSYFIGQTIENWNYSRSFIALNDIFYFSSIMRPIQNKCKRLFLMSFKSIQMCCVIQRAYRAPRRFCRLWIRFFS